MAPIPRPAVTVNAKTIAFDKPGAGLLGYGITPQNIGGKLVRLYNDRETVDGGSRGIWRAMTKNVARSLQRAPNSATAREFDQFLRTGVMPEKPSPAFIRYAGIQLDYGLREVGRAQQHKKGFLDTFLGKIVSIGAQVAAAWVGGPWASAAVGAGLGYVKNHDFMGALMGGIQGYAIGKSVMWAGQGGVGSLFAPANGAGITATGGGTGIANFLTNVGTQAAGALGPWGLVNAGLTVAGAAVAAGAGGRIPRGTGGGSPVTLPPDDTTTPTPVVTAARDTVMRTQRATERNARRMSLLAEGAHTGAGDPRNLRNVAPKARGIPVMRPVSGPTAQPVPMAA